MRTNVLRATAVVVLALIPVAACQIGGDSSFGDPRGSAELALADGLGVQVGHDHAQEVHWQTVDSFDELVRSSDLVIRGTVESRRPAWARLYGWNQVAQRPSTPEEAGGVYRDLPLVVSTVRIHRVLRAGEQAGAAGAGATVEIVELGGRLEDGCFTEPEDKPVLMRGEDAIFFLSSARRPGAYHVVGGWQGRMWVLGGKVRSLAADVHPSDAASTAHDGRPVEELVQAVARIR